MLIAPKIWDEEKLKCFERAQQAEIQNLSVGLSDSEIYEYFGITDVKELPEYDQLFLKVMMARGRLIAKQNACHSLFKAMEGKDALPASLAYLTRFGHDAWASDKGTNAKNPTGIRIILDDGPTLQ